jgi:hypothetical protein
MAFSIKILKKQEMSFRHWAFVYQPTIKFVY